MKKSKGFTLAELLIVVAIMAVLVGVAIPVFSAQLDKSKEATDEANIRSAYAEAISAYLTADADEASYPTSYEGPDLYFEDKLTWTAGDDSLDVEYAAEKISPLTLSTTPSVGS